MFDNYHLVLNKEQEKEFRAWARTNYKVNDPILPTWHPVVQDECRRMNDEKTIFPEGEGKFLAPIRKLKGQFKKEQKEYITAIQHLTMDTVLFEDALNSIACWDQGNELTHLDDPGSALMAREVIHKVRKIRIARVNRKMKQGVSKK